MKVKTHDVTGSRTQYFDDDLSYDLKTLVEKEKSGTAEDQNKMFARLASKVSFSLFITAQLLSFHTLSFSIPLSVSLHFYLYHFLSLLSIVSRSNLMNVCSFVCLISFLLLPI